MFHKVLQTTFDPTVVTSQTWILNGFSANVRQGRTVTFSMRTLRGVPPGRYTLTVRLRSRNFRLTARRSVTVK